MSGIEKLIKKILTRPTDMDFKNVERLLLYKGFKLSKGKGGHRVFTKMETDQVISVPTVQGHRVKRVYLQELLKLLELEAENES